MRKKIGELKNDYGMEIVKIAACIVITALSRILCKLRIGCKTE